MSVGGRASARGRKEYDEQAEGCEGKEEERGVGEWSEGKGRRRRQRHRRREATKLKEAVGEATGVLSASERSVGRLRGLG